MAESDSIPGKLLIKHNAGDTFIRTFIIDIDGVPVDLTGCTQLFRISKTKDGQSLKDFTIGAGIIDTYAAIGRTDFFGQTQVLPANKPLYYFWQLTFPNGTIKTYLEDQFITT